MALKVCPALVAGNSVVMKSAEEAPLAVLRIAELAQQILPPGVFNMLSGMGPECGAPLASTSAGEKVSFTGSVETGKIIASIAAEKLIPTTLELGGKSPMIVMPDADLERAAQGAVIGVRFTRQGQSCTCASRIFVHRSLHDEFVAIAKIQGRCDEDRRSIRRCDRYRQHHFATAIRARAQLCGARRKNAGRGQPTVAAR